MKKILFLISLIVLAFVCQAQIIDSWNGSINTANLVGEDTVIQASGLSNIASAGWSVTLDAEALDADDSEVTFGGGNKSLLFSANIYSFDAFQADSLPYVLDRSKMVDTIKVAGQTDTTYTVTITGGNVPYGHRTPALRFYKNSVTSGIFRWYFIFYKL